MKIIFIQFIYSSADDNEAHKHKKSDSEDSSQPMTIDSKQR